MSIVRNLLQRGNSKLGEAVHHWSLPAFTTCPDRSALCEHHCYARGGRFRTRRVQYILARNLLLAARDDFEDRMVKEVKRCGVHVLRVHVSGDFLCGGPHKKSPPVWMRTTLISLSLTKATTAATNSRVRDRS